MPFCFSDYDDYFDEYGELRNPPKIDLDNIPPETQSCSQCIHFTGISARKPTSLDVG